jgi:hypothetical protein
MLLREEAAGHRTPLLAGGPRVALGLGRHARLSAAYFFGWAGAGSPTLGADTQHHRLFLRAEVGVPLRAAWLFLGVGPVAALQSTALTAGAERAGPTATLLRAGLCAGAGVDVRLPSLTVRAGFDVLAFGGRWDLSPGVGLTLPLGGSR